jgi:hypothetical protein
MQPSDYALTERVQASFSQLASAAKDLNQVSDELGQAINAIDSVLQTLNLGVPTWVEIHGGTDETGIEYWSREIGYSKIGNRWGVSLRQLKGDINYPQYEECESWLFNDAPRWMRVEGIEKIPNLLEELIKNTVQTTQKIKGTIDQAQQFAGALTDAANQFNSKKVGAQQSRDKFKAGGIQELIKPKEGSR